MKKSSSTTLNLLYKPKLSRPLSIQKLLAPLHSRTPLPLPSKQNQHYSSNLPASTQLIRIRSTQKLLSRYPSSTSIQQKKQYILPNRWLVKAKDPQIQSEIATLKEIPKIFKRRKSAFPQSEKQIGGDMKEIAKRNNETLKQSKIERKLIIKNPFEKRQQEIQFLQLTKCDQSAIAHHSQMTEDISEINNIVKTINSQQFL